MGIPQENLSSGELTPPPDPATRLSNAERLLQGEKIGLEAEIIEVLYKRIMERYHIATQFEETVRHAIGSMWTTYFALLFRQKCCDKAGGLGLKPALHEKIQGRGKEERVDAAFDEFGYDDNEGFMNREEMYIRNALLEAGIDIDVIDAARQIEE